MSFYKPRKTTIESSQRCYRLVGESPLGGVPRIDFLEEMVTVTDGIAEKKPVAGCSLVLDPLAIIPLLDPLTGIALGRSVTHGDIYTILYSAYRNAAELRDKVKKTL